MLNKKISYSVIGLLLAFSLVGCNDSLASGLGELVTDKLCDITNCSE